MNPSVESFLQSNLPTYLELLRRMVEINSFTANAEGVNRLARLTGEIFAPLGFRAEYVQSNNPKFGTHLFLSRPAARPEGKAIVMVSHLDTVFPPEEEVQNNFYFRRMEDRIYGPGSLDIKGGSVLMYMVLDALHTFTPQVFDNTSWLLALNASEEVLSDDFGLRCVERLPHNSLACLIFEGGTPVPDAISLVTARKGRATFSIQVQGRGAHAGNYHANGANAIVQIAHTIQKVASFTDYDKQITFNVGVVQGGSVVNRVPHYAEAQVEMRAFRSDVYDEGIAKMEALEDESEVSSVDGYPCRVTIQVDERTAPWPPNEQTGRLFKVWTEAAASLGWRTIEERRGGLSDGNFMWNHLPTLDGLGPNGANAHCSEYSTDGSKDQEYSLASSFVPKALLNVAGITRLLDQPSA